MQTPFSELSTIARGLETAKVCGTVSAVRGLKLTVTGLERAMGIGQRCLVQGARGPVLGEVVGIDADGTHVLPFGSWDGVAAGDQVELSRAGGTIRPDDSWVGRVIDAIGRPLDGSGPLHEGARARSVKAQPPSAFSRRRVGARLDTGIKTFDIFTPLCRG
ncbi:hypothetical protein LCGC14_2163220, partial [marine sediment metagenome]